MGAVAATAAPPMDTDTAVAAAAVSTSNTARVVFAPVPRGLAGLLFLAALVLAVVATASAQPLATLKTIAGTARNDVLRGTAGTDTINGKAGNDTIWGLAGNDHLNGGPGNDLIVGGPGADAISCGPGSDTVVADRTDTVAPDCETIRGVASRATAGHYTGTTGQGKLFGFDVDADGKTMTNIVLTADIRCTHLIGHNIGTTAGPVSIDPRQGIFSGALPQSDLIAGGSISGTFDANHAARGTFQVDFVDPVDAGGTCSTGPISWTAQPTPSILIPGHYSGVTDFAGTNVISFDVLPDGRTVSNLTVATRLTCQPGGATIRGTTAQIGPVPPLTGRRLVFSGGVSNPTTGNPYTITLDLTFDAAGYFTGTADLHVTVAGQGSTAECDTGQLNWQGSLDR